MKGLLSMPQTGNTIGVVPNEGVNEERVPLCVCVCVCVTGEIREI